MAEGGAMWIVGDWGQSSPWSRDTGVKMVKGKNNVWTGELSLTKGTKFDIKILKSTVSTTSGGANTWSAVRYTSTLNNSASHDFGEFTDNLIPNGNFDEGKVKWTPADVIHAGAYPHSSPNMALVSKFTTCSSDVFTIPPGQTLTFSGYLATQFVGINGIATVKVVAPQQQTLLEFDVKGIGAYTYKTFSKNFKSLDVPVECQITLSYTNVEGHGDVIFDTLSLVSV